METIIPEEVFDILADDYCREILAHANDEPMSAQKLAQTLDAHHSTIYRRLERLEDLGLIVGQQRVDVEEGHHYTVYKTTLEEITVNLNNDQYSVRLRRVEDPIDRMAQMWQQIRGDQP